MGVAPERPVPPPLRQLGPGAAGLLSLLVFVSLPLIPVLGMVLALLAPLPLVHLLAGGRPSILGWGWVATMLVGLALVSQASWVLLLAFGYILLAAWPAVSVELRLRRAWSEGRWLAAVTVTALVLAAVFLVGYCHPSAPADRLAEMLLPDASRGGELLDLFGGGSLRNEEFFAWAVRVTSYLAPALIAIYVGAGALWLRPRLSLLGLPTEDSPFALFSSEEWLPVGFAIGGLGWVFASGTAKWLSANLLTVVLGLYFVHGLAIIHFHLGRRLAANRWVRLAVALFALQMPLTVVVAALGLTDTFFRLRRGGALEGGSER